MEVYLMPVRCPVPARLDTLVFLPGGRAQTGIDRHQLAGGIYHAK